MSARVVEIHRAGARGHLIDTRPPNLSPRRVLMDDRPVVRGLPIVNGADRRNDCGRHTPAKIVGEP
ncbi:MAG: hypothetical protein ACK4WH_06785 [Phycisphaerales bacterium]